MNSNPHSFPASSLQVVSLTQNVQRMFEDIDHDLWLQCGQMNAEQEQRRAREAGDREERWRKISERFGPPNPPKQGAQGLVAPMAGLTLSGAGGRVGA